MKILVCGKGYSLKYYEEHDHGYDYHYGYNQDVSNKNFDVHFYSKSKEKDVRLSENIITESFINDKFGLETLKLGSTSFGLYQLLHYISQIHHGSTVDLVGFDFRYIYEEEARNPEAGIQAFINIESQKILAIKLKKLFTDITVRFIGFDDFSDIDPKTGLIISKNTSNVEIVAEITTNHCGDSERLIQLITSAKKAGADSVKLQMRDVDSFYSKEKLDSEYNSPFGETFRDYRLGLELTDNQILMVDDLCKRLGIKYFFSILDKPSFFRLIQFNPDRIKLPSTISNKKEYIDFVFKNFKKEIVVSTGMTDQNFVNYIMEVSKDTEKLFLLHCISSYPVNIFSTNLKIISNYAKLSPSIVAGYSSHDIGHVGSMFAVFSGAKMIEKHIKLGNSDFAHFDETALDVEREFPEFVEKIRDAEMIYGSGEKVVLTCEHHKY